MTADTKMTLIATLISSIVSSLVTILINYILQKKSEKSRLDSCLDELLKISIKYPYLESSYFTKTWKENCKNEDEKYRRYENYATMVFNYLSNVCAFFRYNENKINDYLDIKGWIKIHKDYWYHPTKDGENENVYDENFKKLVHGILGSIQDQ